MIKVKQLKEIATRLLLLALLSAFIQACSSNQSRPIDLESEKVRRIVSEKKLLATALGNTAINDAYISKSTSLSMSAEYQIASVYTAASGRRCKEVKMTSPDEAAQALEVICLDGQGHWYWPRKIILQ